MFAWALSGVLAGGLIGLAADGAETPGAGAHGAGGRETNAGPTPMIPEQVDPAAFRCGFEVIPAEGGYAPLIQQRQDFFQELQATVAVAAAVR